MLLLGTAFLQFLFCVLAQGMLCSYADLHVRQAIHWHTSVLASLVS